MAALLEFEVLGPLELRAGGRSIQVRAPRQRTILAMLLLSAGHVVPIDSFLEAVWNGRPPVTGRTQIAICVTALRKLIRTAGHTDDVIISESPGYLLRAEATRIDAVEFADQVRTARSLDEDGRLTEAVERYTEALDLWHGSAFAGVTGYPVEVEAARLEQERLTVYEQRAKLKLALGQHRSLVGELAALVRENPLRESARTQLMLAQYRSGQRAEALQTFREGRQQHIEELGLEPGRPLRELHGAILRDSPSLAAPVEVTSRPQAAIVPAQLPANVPAFIGRHRELAELDTLFNAEPSADRARVGLVTGAVGVGKTGLAVHWAHRIARRASDGQLFADLHGDDDDQPVQVGSVLASFLRALGVPADRIPWTLAGRAERYRDALAGKRVLVVLDNASRYEQLGPLIPTSGSCVVVVTGRAELGKLCDHHGPTNVRLGPLTVADSVELLSSVLGARASGAGRDDLTELAELCGRLPLTLRMAAATLIAKPHWTVAGLIERLADPRRRRNTLLQLD